MAAAATKKAEPVTTDSVANKLETMTIGKVIDWAMEQGQGGIFKEKADEIRKQLDDPNLHASLKEPLNLVLTGYEDAEKNSTTPILETIANGIVYIAQKHKLPLALKGSDGSGKGRKPSTAGGKPSGGVKAIEKVNKDTQAFDVLSHIAAHAGQTAKEIETATKIKAPTVYSGMKAGGLIEGSNDRPQKLSVTAKGKAALTAAK